MIGQGSPRVSQCTTNRPANAREGPRWRRGTWCAVCFCWSVFVCSSSWAEVTTVRVRLAWGSGADMTQRWSGQITVDGATFSDLQPLGIEADEAAALRLEADRLLVAPLEKRRFDGCDVTVTADRQAKLRVELRSDQAPQAKLVETTLDEVIRGQFRAPLDEFGSFLLAHRSPGDKLRVIPPRDSLVFSPGEQWILRLQPDLADEAAAAAVMLNLQLRALGDDAILWQASQSITAQTPPELAFDIVSPQAENAYRVTIEARGQERLGGRFVPWQQAKVFASRDVEFVVIDPDAKLPPLVDRWLPVLSVDPANPSWWQRLPSWAQMSRLRGRPPGAVGNVRPVVRPGPRGELVELPPAPAEGDPYWQAYTLPVKEPGAPHLIELEYPVGAEQHLSISVIEPDAAGRVTTPNVDAGVFTEANPSAAEGETAVYRIVFWPRTRSPQLLLVNQHASLPAQFGKLTLLRHDDAAAAQESLEQQPGGERLVAGYISQPDFAANFGSAELLDAPSGLSVQNWSTFLGGAQRLAQYLKLCGYNGALVTVAADGSSLYPSDVWRPSPRYDTGLMASRAQDPTRKDVLEMLLRVFDREGLRLVPTLQLAAPLPRLEELRGADTDNAGISLVDHTGNTWLERNAPSAGLAAYYNPLNEQVQAEVSRMVEELAERYGSHRALAGVGIQLSGEGYGMLPGLTWALDDHTIAAFSEDTQIPLPTEGADRFLRRAESLVGIHRQEWQLWRTEKLSGHYSRLAADLTRARDDLQLVLTTEDLFAGPLQQKRLREAVSGAVQLDQALRDCGLDLAKLDQQEHVTVLGAYRWESSSLLSRQALDLRLNLATDQGEFFPQDKDRGVLVYHLQRPRRLASFDRLSPYGTAQTHLTLASQSLPGGAGVRKQVVTALARGDARMIVEGGLRQPLGQHAELRRVLETIQQLPDVHTEARVQAKQPLLMRVYRSADSTTILVLNESPWPVGVRLPLQTAAECAWRRLGAVASASSGEPLSQTGALAGGDQLWELELAPYDLQAWTFATEQLRVGEPQIAVDDVARAQLQQRIDEIESRTGNLNIQRPYLQLQNPGFELLGTDERIFGWQTRGGSPGAVSLAAGEAHAGNQALRLKSEDGAGAVVESHLFPMPLTGQLVVGAFVRGREVAPDAQLHIAIEDGEDGRTYQQYATLSAEQLSAAEWTWYEFPVDDVPFDANGQMRVRFHLTGAAEVLLDDVELYDLRFDSARRGALVKRIYAAKTALEEGQVIDCQRLVDGYWSRYLVEYVPPVQTAEVSIAKQPAAPEPTSESEEVQHEPKESSGFGSRLRNWMPRIWR